MNGQLTIPHDLYEDILNDMMPMIRRKAARLKGHMDMDDAIQEARIVVYKVLHSYDFNRNPDMERFVGVCLNNAFAGQFHRMSAQRRMPRRPIQETDGTWTTKAAPPLSLEEMDAADRRFDPERSILESESEGVVKRMLRAIRSQLNDKERAAIDVFIDPPAEIDIPPGEPGFNKAAAAYLGINKNTLDWRLWRPRELMLEAMRNSDFNANLTSGPEWPHLVHSDVWDDQMMILETIGARQLDPIPRDTEARATGDAKMLARVYEWGEALCLKMGEASATLLLQGRFNRLSGALHGLKYGSQQVPIPWYQQCMKMLTHGTPTQS